MFQNRKHKYYSAIYFSKMYSAFGRFSYFFFRSNRICNDPSENSACIIMPVYQPQFSKNCISFVRRTSRKKNSNKISSKICDCNFAKSSNEQKKINVRISFGAPTIHMTIAFLCNCRFGYISQGGNQIQLVLLVSS